MPSTPFIVNGTIYDSRGNNISDVIITFNSSTKSKNVISTATGEYLIDLANIDYTAGETISYSAKDKNDNEVYSGSFAATGENKTLNITLSVRTERLPVAGNRDTQLFNIGGKTISKDNPFPVMVIDAGDVVDLVNNPSTTWGITRSDRQPDYEEITIGSKVYRRTFTYTNNVMTARSKWVKQ